MGAAFMKPALGPTIHPSTGTNLEARSLGGVQSAGQRASGTAVKDVAAAQALGQMSKILHPITKTAASNAPGPKKT
jgi:hypothetical protein